MEKVLLIDTHLSTGVQKITGAENIKRFLQTLDPKEIKNVSYQTWYGITDIKLIASFSDNVGSVYNKKYKSAKGFLTELKNQI